MRFDLSHVLGMEQSASFGRLENIGTKRAASFITFETRGRPCRSHCDVSVLRLLDNVGVMDEGGRGGGSCLGVISYVVTHISSFRQWRGLRLCFCYVVLVQSFCGYRY